MAVNPIDSFFQAETGRGRVVSSNYPTPPAFNIVSKWQPRILHTSDILDLQIYTEPRTESVTCGTTQLFQILGTTNVGEVSQRLEDVPTDSLAYGWIESVFSPSFRQRVIEAPHYLPYIFITDRPNLVEGHIPDGNHRALLFASILNEEGLDLDIRAWYGKTSLSKWLIFNTRVLRQAHAQNPELTSKLLQERRRTLFRRVI